jgi:FkbM family methyltransferase
MHTVKQIARGLVPSWSIEGTRYLLEKADPFVRLSYSQDGEDMILRRMFEGKSDGFYVDVGAHHPCRFSNTYHFHRRGWRGINIDANPEAISQFRRHRPADVNLCVGIADTPGTLMFHRFNEPALDTFDPALAAERSTLPDYRLVDRLEIEVQRLEDVLGKHLPKGRKIDFLSVDVEGFDLQVLKSNDWIRFRPRVLLVEARAAQFEDLAVEPSCTFARSVGYRPVAKTVNTVIFTEGASA